MRSKAGEDVVRAVAIEVIREHLRATADSGGEVVLGPLVLGS
jgi:hypothetical protein